MLLKAWLIAKENSPFSVPCQFNTMRENRDIWPKTFVPMMQCLEIGWTLKSCIKSVAKYPMRGTTGISWQPRHWHEWPLYNPEHECPWLIARRSGQRWPCLEFVGLNSNKVTRSSIWWSDAYETVGLSSRSLSRLLKHEVIRNISTPPGCDVIPSEGYPQQ